MKSIDTFMSQTPQKSKKKKRGDICYTDHIKHFCLVIKAFQFSSNLTLCIRLYFIVVVCFVCFQCLLHADAFFKIH